MTTQRITRYLLISLISLISHTSLAATALQAPQLIIEHTSQALQSQLQDPDFAKDKLEIRNFVDKEIFPNIDTIRMSALVLGKHWRKASREQKIQFIAAFKKLLVNTYSATFTEQFDSWNIQYLPLNINPEDKKVTVKTLIHQKGKPATKIDYSMILKKESWLIYDLKVEGISLVISNRDTFNQMIKETGSIDGVIHKLQEKNSK